MNKFICQLLCHYYGVKEEQINVLYYGVSNGTLMVKHEDVENGEVIVDEIKISLVGTAKNSGNNFETVKMD
jgi:hypothetical protein